MEFYIFLLIDLKDVFADVFSVFKGQDFLQPVLEFLLESFFYKPNKFGGRKTHTDRDEQG